ncbi:hypothetical protein Tco_0972504, partial [Tanacetum coccineum]
VPKIYMNQFWFTINKKDSTSYRFKIDKKRCTLNMEVFREISQICPRLLNQDFDELPSDEEIVSFIKELSHKGYIKSITEVVVDHMYQPWRTFAAIINKYLSRKITTSPKTKRKLKKPASPLKKRTLSFGVQIQDTPGVSVSKKKAPAKVARSKGIKLLSDASSIEKGSQKKKKRNNHSSSRNWLKLGVPDVSKGDSSKSENESWGDSGDEDIDDEQGDNERIESDVEPTETDNPKTSDDEEETQDDKFVHTLEDYVPPDDEINDESNDVTKEEYERVNEELHGDVNISLADAEPVGKEKDDEEMTIAGHVNVNQEGVGNQVKDDAQAIQKTEVPIPSSSISSDYAAKYLNFDNIPPVNTEVVSMLDINVQHEVPRTSPLLTIPVSVIPEHTIANPPEIVITTSSTTISYLLSSLFPHLQQLTPIPTPITTEATTSTTSISESKTLAALQLRVTNLEKDVKELKDVDNSSKVISTIQSEVPKAVKEYLGSSLDDAMHKVIPKNVADIIKEHSVPAETV